MSQIGFWVSIVAAAAWLVLFGLWYAWNIARRPFRPGLTWLSVVLGCEATLIGMAVLLWSVTHFLLGVNTWLAALVAICVPHAAFVLTGAPMILFQIHKDCCFADAAFNMTKTKGRRHDGRDAEESAS